MSESQTQVTTTTQTNSTTTSSSTASSSTHLTGMDAIFALQGWICDLNAQFAKNSAKDSQRQSEMGEEIGDMLDDNYDKIIDALAEKAKYESESHGIGGFFKGLGHLLKDLSKTIADLSVGATVGAMMTGNMDGISSKLNDDLKSMEQNPILNDLIKGLTWVAVGAAIITAGLTGGTASALVLATIVLATEFGGVDLLSKGCGDAIEAISGGYIPSDIADTIGDVMAIATVAMAAAASGGTSVAFMAGGTMVGAMSQKLSEDLADSFGLTGDARNYFVMGSTITFALLSVAVTAGGGYMAASKMGQLSENAQMILNITTKAAAGAQMASGLFKTVGGLRDVKIGEIMEKMMNFESENSLLDTFMTNLNSTMESTQNNQRAIHDQYGGMISQFGAISSPNRAAAMAMA